MWKKNFRSKSSMEYRKKYKCPECDEYSLYVIHDTTCECENDCDVESVSIFKIMKQNDFEGYFTSEEIKDNFYTDDALFNKNLESILIDKRPYEIDKEQIKKLHKIAKRTYHIDEELDDMMAKYLNKNKIIDEENMNDFGYVINLVEDINYFIDCCHKDIVLMNYGIKFASRNFRSGRFYYNNAIDHLFLANERIYILMGIVYDYKFSDKLFQNRTPKIKKYLASKELTNSILVNFIESKDINFQELREIRCTNTHSLSYYSKKILDDVDKNGDKNLEFWNRDGSEIDRDILIPKVYQITKYLEILYDVLNVVIEIMSDRIEEYSGNTIPMIKKFIKIDYSNKSEKSYDIEDLKWFSSKKESILIKSITNKNKIMSDIFFRLEEIHHCLINVFEINSGTYYNEWKSNGIVEIDQLINMEYFLYSGLLRIHSCYDKIAVYINDKHYYEEIRYFSQFKGISIEQNDIGKKIKKILDNDNYKLLNRLRNNLFHNLRCGSLYGQSGIDYYNCIIIKLLFENLKMQYEFIDYLLK